MIAQNERRLDDTAMQNAVGRLNDFISFDLKSPAMDQFKKALHVFGAGFLQLERSILAHEGHVTPAQRANVIKGEHFMNKEGVWGTGSNGVHERQIWN